MKKLIAIVMVMSTLSMFAIGSENNEIYHATATDMKVISSSYGFSNVGSVDISLKSDYVSEEPTTLEITIRYNDESERIEVKELEIQNIRRTGCGDTYVAGYNDEETHGRMHVVLTDMSNALCEIYVEHLWSAKVREGYGWCGTGDSEMTVVGTPELTR